MGFFDRNKIEKGLFGLAAAAVKGAEKAKELATAAANSDLAKDAAEKLKQASDAAAPHLKNLQDRAAPHVEALKVKAEEIAEDVKEVINGPDYTKIGVDELVSLKNKNDERLKLLVANAKLEGLPFSYLESDNRLTVLTVQENKHVPLLKKDTLDLNGAQRSIALDIINVAEANNKISDVLISKGYDLNKIRQDTPSI